VKRLGCNEIMLYIDFVFAVQVGFVNSLQFSDDGSLLVAGVGTEHRLGRWWHLKSAKNCVCIVRLKRLSASRKSDILL